MWAIVHASCLVSVLVADETPPDRREAVGLEVEALRRRYADLYLEARRLRHELAQLEHSAAHLLEGRTAGTESQAAQRMAALLERSRADQVALYRSLVELDGFLEAVMDAVLASDATREELRRRMDAVRTRSARLAAPPSAVAGRGGDSAGREVHVLAVDTDLQVVVLDVGSRDAVPVGSLWRIRGTDNAQCVMRIVETRERISAALVVQGAAQDIESGLRCEPIGRDDSRDSAGGR